MSFDSLQDSIQKLKAGQALSMDVAAGSALALADPGVADAEKADLLRALNDKGETALELTAFATVFRGLARNPDLGDYAERAIDVCGTGGDGAGSFNVSTAVSLILASMGIPVFKHGNRSITSKCGSADLLEACGIPLELETAQLRQSIEALNFVFLFAPGFHPAFKSIAPVRKALAAEGRRTIFNLLGPLINPGKPSFQLLGVFRPEWLQPIANSLHDLKLQAAVVVHGSNGHQCYDELVPFGENHLAGAGRLRDKNASFNCCDLGIAPGSEDELAGGDVAENRSLLYRLIGTEGPPVPPTLHDTVCLNAGTALWVVGQVSDIQSGFRAVADHLYTGAVADWLRRAQTFYSQLVT
jgi:anthranilate phosphoribosyltransferase